MIVLNVEKGTTGKIVILEKPYFSWDLGVRFFYMKKLYYSLLEMGRQVNWKKMERDKPDVWKLASATPSIPYSQQTFIR